MRALELPAPQLPAAAQPRLALFPQTFEHPLRRLIQVHPDEARLRIPTAVLAEIGGALRDRKMLVVAGARPKFRQLAKVHPAP
jgi:hypothetical protein